MEGLLRGLGINTQNQLDDIKDALPEHVISVARQAFHLYDHDRTGRISLQVTKKLLGTLAIYPDDEELEEMKNKADLDGDGILEFNEFLFMLKGYFEEEEVEDVLLDAMIVHDPHLTGMLPLQEAMDIVKYVTDGAIPHNVYDDIRDMCTVAATVPHSPATSSPQGGSATEGEEGATVAEGDASQWESGVTTFAEESAIVTSMEASPESNETSDSSRGSWESAYSRESSMSVTESTESGEKRGETKKKKQQQLRSRAETEAAGVEAVLGAQLIDYHEFVQIVCKAAADHLVQVPEECKRDMEERRSTIRNTSDEKKKTI